jgi:hypothetical protein
MRRRNKLDCLWRIRVKLGPPGPVEALSAEPFKNLKPFSTEESRRCFAEPDPDFAALAEHCAFLPVPIPEQVIKSYRPQ